MNGKKIIFRIVFCYISIVLIFGTIIAEEEEEEEEQNMSIKFNQMPDVDIRSINDRINKTIDGSVELFASNPSSNQFPLQVDFIAIIPSGITLYSDSLPLVEKKPGAVIGSFQVIPGQKREIYIRVKSSNIGNYSVQYNQIYYPVGHKSENVENTVTNYFVEEPSMSAFIPDILNGTNDISTTKTSSFISIGIVFAIVMLVFLYRRMK